MIENDNWRCEQEDDGNIVCEDKNEYTDKTVKMESGRGPYASMRVKTDRGDDVIGTALQDMINVKANKVGNIRQRGDGLGIQAE